MFELALEKMRGSHTNMSRLQLKTEEATQHKTSDSAYASIVRKKTRSIQQDVEREIDGVPIRCDDTCNSSDK